MSSEVPIPEEAIQAACDAYEAAVLDETPRDSDDLSTHEEIAAVRAAAPLIVAAAVERLAAELTKPGPIPNDEWDNGHQDGLVTAAAALRAHVSVLRGEGQT